MALIAACTQSGRKAGFRLLKPPGKRLVSTGASLKPELRRSHDE
jgi:mRNA-degrading endonuclease toxin of MazEF toxin-antitoxin module